MTPEELANIERRNTDLWRQWAQQPAQTAEDAGELRTQLLSILTDGQDLAREVLRLRRILEDIAHDLRVSGIKDAVR